MLDLAPPSDAWPLAVRSAELLRGTLVRCGPGVRPIGRPETPESRIAAAAPWLQDRIACGATAAWVWGARPHPGPALHCATRHRRRPPAVLPPGVVVHQLTLDAEDVVEVAGRAVTAPLRTAVDLLKSVEFDRPERAAVRLLALAGGHGRARLRAEVRRGGRADRLVAYARIAAL